MSELKQTGSETQIATSADVSNAVSGVAHLSGNETFTGTKTFNNTIYVGDGSSTNMMLTSSDIRKMTNGTVKTYSFPASAGTLELQGHTHNQITSGDTKVIVSGSGSAKLITESNYPTITIAAGTYISNYYGGTSFSTETIVDFSDGETEKLVGYDTFRYYPNLSPNFDINGSCHFNIVKQQDGSVTVSPDDCSTSKTLSAEFDSTTKTIATVDQIPDMSGFVQVTGDTMQGDLCQEITMNDPFVSGNASDDTDGTGSTLDIYVKFNGISYSELSKLISRGTIGNTINATIRISINGTPTSDYDFTSLTGEHDVVLTYNSSEGDYEYLPNSSTTVFFLYIGSISSIEVGVGSDNNWEHYYYTSPSISLQSAQRIGTSRFITEYEAEEAYGEDTFSAWRRGNILYAGANSDSLSGYTNGIFFGNNIKSSGANNVIIGNGAYNTSGSSVVIGVGASATKSGNVSIGPYAYTYGSSTAVAIGSGARASYLGTAVGPVASAIGGDSSVAIGWKTKAENGKDVAIGREAQTSGGDGNYSNIAIGAWSKIYATSTQPSICIGGTTISGSMSVGIGSYGGVKGSWSTAIGGGGVTGDNSVALRGNVNANYAVQLGEGTNSTNNTLQFLSKKIADSNGYLYENNANINTIYQKITDMSTYQTTAGMSDYQPVSAMTGYASSTHTHSASSITYTYSGNSTVSGALNDLYDTNLYLTNGNNLLMRGSSAVDSLILSGNKTVATTDQIPSIPSTTALLKGNGSGGISAAVAGTDYLTTHQTLKTINNTSLIGTGNIAITPGDTNIIETIKVNGSALTPDANKAVDITIPNSSVIPILDLYVDASTPTVSFTMDQTVGWYRGCIGSDGVLPTLDWSNFSMPTDSVYQCTLALRVNSSATTLTGPSDISWVAGAGLPTSSFAGHWIFISLIREGWEDCFTQAAVWRVL